jgi:hypothetical protein
MRLVVGLLNTVVTRVVIRAVARVVTRVRGAIAFRV